MEDGAGVPAEGVMAAKKFAGKGTGDCLDGTCIADLVDFRDRLIAAGKPTLYDLETGVGLGLLGGWIRFLYCALIAGWYWWLAVPNIGAGSVEAVCCADIAVCCATGTAGPLCGAGTEGEAWYGPGVLTGDIAVKDARRRRSF